MARPTLELGPEQLAAALEEFLADHPRAVVVEDGAILFDMSLSRFTLDSANGRCVLQLWSEERNLVRTVVGLEARKESLRVEVRRFGQTRPQVLRFVADRDQRTPSTRDATRQKYVRVLERVLTRCFADYRRGDLHASADLEHSFGPAYVRGTLERGQGVWAVVGVNAEETQSTVDAVLSVAVLWLDHCRQRECGRRIVQGVKVIVPAGAAGTVRERMAWLDPRSAKWELYELEERGEELLPSETGVNGNQRTQLLAAFTAEAALARSREALDRVLGLLPAGARVRTDVEARSPTEVSFRVHGLEFARIRHQLAAGSFAREDAITFGAGAHETSLNAETEDLFQQLTGRLFASRRVSGLARDPLYRLQPERWLESVLRRELELIDSNLAGGMIYSQVPAMASADRGMLDLLAITRAGRLAVLELKAGEDLHMPFQGLDYWMRVRDLHREDEFTRSGYFPGVKLSPAAPLLYFVVPSLRLHSACETLLKHISPEVEWRLIALDERWRERRKVVFRKQGGTGLPLPSLHHPAHTINDGIPNYGVSS
jgi:hypothetical protein